MRSLIFVLLFSTLLSAFSLDGVIDSISNKVSNAVGNKISKTISNYGSTDKKTKQHIEQKSSKVEQTNTQSSLKKLKELVSMRDHGYITKNEFLKARKELFSKGIF